MNIKISKYNINNRTEILKFISRTEFTSRNINSWKYNKMTASIAKINNKIVGVLPFETVSLKIKNKYENVLWISSLYVNQDLRNKRIGSLLLDHSIRTFKKKINYFFVIRHDEGTKAYRWYLKNNFVKISKIISLEKIVNNQNTKINYTVLNNFLSFKNHGNKLLKSFKKNNSDYDGFKKRHKNFWFKLKYHYYAKSYQFKILIFYDENILNYALVGKTKMRDTHYRLDILEFISHKNSKLDLFDLIEHYAYKNKCKKIRFQTTNSNVDKNSFLKNKFYIRWETNTLVKKISDKKIDFLNYKFFQTEYI